MGVIPFQAVTNHFFRRGKTNFRGSRHRFQPHNWGRGRGNPSPNDSLKASLNPPVGGCLRSFRRDWQTNKSLSFYSRLFLVPKPHQRWRPVIDLSRLNTFLHIEKFKMETPESIRTSLIPGEWVSSIDLSDAYLHTPFHPNSRKYPRFCHRSQVFQFTSLPFGLATAPQVFTMIVKEVKLMTLSRGLRLHQYLDDWLIRSQSQEKAQVNSQAVVDLTQYLGWIINQEKSELKPTQVFSFVGYVYHLDSALVKPTQERWLNHQDLILRLGATVAEW